MTSKLPVEFSFSKDGPIFSHKITIVDSNKVPDLFGVDFFDKYNASVSFASKIIVLNLGSEDEPNLVEVPFTVEESTSEEASGIAHVANVSNADAATTPRKRCSAEAVAMDRIVLGWANLIVCP